MTIGLNSTMEEIIEEINSKGSGIIDVAVLPSVGGNNLDEKAIYRVPHATFFTRDEGKVSSNEMHCNVLAELPSVGNPAVTFDSNLNPIYIETYFIPEENLLYGYVDSNLSVAGGGIPVGWYPAENLFPLINVTYGGVIYATAHAVAERLYLLIEYDLYGLKNGRFELINVNESKSYDWENTHTFKKKAVFDKEVDFNSDSQVTFNGEVDFNNANVTGLQSGGGLTKTKVTLAELQALLTAENMGMLVSIICKSATLRDYNGVVAPMLKVGYSTLSTNAPEVFNRYIYSISDSYFNGQPVLQFNEYLLRISKGGVVFTKYTYRINKSTLEYSSASQALKTDLTDSNFDFYVYK